MLLFTSAKVLLLCDIDKRELQEIASFGVMKCKILQVFGVVNCKKLQVLGAVKCKILQVLSGDEDG